MLKPLQVLMTTLMLAGLALANPLLEEKFWETATPADVQRAVQKGAKVNARDQDGRTPCTTPPATTSNPRSSPPWSS